MLSLKEQYDNKKSGIEKQIFLLKNKTFNSGFYDEIKNYILNILNGEVECDTFYRSITERITVFRDKHTEVKLNNLPLVFHFYY